MSIFIEKWSFESTRDTVADIMPDGCRDIIIEQDDTGQLSYFISPLVSSAYQVELSKGTKLTGYRLQPGATINQKLLAELMHNFDLDLLKTDAIADCAFVKSSVNEALAALSSDLLTIAAIAKNLGVSHRTLQRYLKAENRANTAILAIVSESAPLWPFIKSK